MTGIVPGPLCSHRLGADWIDDGTLCVAKSYAPGPLGGLSLGPMSIPFKDIFDRDHVYSMAVDAGRKRAIDLQIIGNDYGRGGEIRMDNSVYLRQLIDIVSDSRRTVQGAAPGMQFYIVKGGAEGLLPEGLRDTDADRNVMHWTDTDGHVGETDFDENDLLAVFGRDGSLVGAARLRRPTFVETRIRRETAAKVFAAWDAKPVLIYRNTSSIPGWIPYLGLGVRDGFRNHGVAIDIHKVESTNGCFFIDDPTQFVAGAPDVRTFEPVLIKKVIAAKGLAEADITGKSIDLGKMNVLDVSPF